MRCEEASARLSLFHDKEDADPELVEHVGACGSCGRVLRELESMSRLLAESRSVVAGPGFGTRVLALLEERQQLESAQWWRSLTLRLVPIALVALLLAGLAMFRAAMPQEGWDLERETLALGGPILAVGQPPSAEALAHWTMGFEAALVGVDLAPTPEEQP